MNININIYPLYEFVANENDYSKHFHVRCTIFLYHRYNNNSFIFIPTSNHITYIAFFLLFEYSNNQTNEQQKNNNNNTNNKKKALFIHQKYNNNFGVFTTPKKKVISSLCFFFSKGLYSEQILQKKL